MMRRSMVALALLGLVAIPSAVYAQGGGGGRGRGGPGGGGVNPIQVVIEHKADLKVTDEQGKKLEEMLKVLETANAPHVAEMQKMRDAGTMDREAMMAINGKMRANSEEAQAKLKDVLNAEQFEMATKLIAEATPQRGRRGGGTV